ncbi:MAG: glycogen/starch/alpha-glucan phosphorylase [Clostridia bacterium]|nr:glycogen/starch/alpha-glucan phosphorylase [Clostridia bacterium]
MGTSNREITREELSAELEKKFGVTVSEGTAEQLYFTLSGLIMNRLKENLDRTAETQAYAKKVCYLSMEFLVGKNFKYTASALGLLSEINELLASSGSELTVDSIAGVENDPGLGNGGLGRLAACYMNSLSTLGYPAVGYSILYEKGFFTQTVIDGEQIEKADGWLKTGKIWLIPREEESVEVSMGGKVRELWGSDRLRIVTEGAERFRAVPYDLPVQGFGTETVNYIRLWKAERIVSSNDPYVPKSDEWDGELISSSLYPSDDGNEGKLLRLSQQYFLVGATLADIVARHKRLYGSLERFAEMNAIHINDTHPALAIPELMRILMDENGYSWDDSWGIVSRVFSYTNHTVMPEALESWNVDLFRLRLPRIYRIVKEINEKVCERFWGRFPGDFSRISRMAPIAYSRIRMANLCASACHSVNGVSEIHSEIIKTSVFRDHAEFAPEKFTSVTNGVSHIRWLVLCNPELTSLITEAIGDGFLNEPEALTELLKFKDDSVFLESLLRVKSKNGKRFLDFCAGSSNDCYDPEGIIDVHIKRFHEYKRQLLNALKILYVYIGIKEGRLTEIPPVTFVFGGKAAPGYKTAKNFLKLIWNIGVLIYSDKAVRDRIKVVFAENYGVSSAEVIIPAAHIGEQISLAGKEASGTGCMKLMMNGALLLGTPDGANLEIRDSVGEENSYIFGLDSSGAERIAHEGYRPMKYYMQSDKIRAAVDALDLIPDGSLADDIKRYLLFSGDRPDPYMCLCDFEPYLNVWERAVKDASDRSSYAEKSLVNIAMSGRFSSDRSIREYAEKIWKTETVR